MRWRIRWINGPLWVFSTHWLLLFLMILPSPFLIWCGFESTLGTLACRPLNELCLTVKLATSSEHLPSFRLTSDSSRGYHKTVVPRLWLTSSPQDCTVPLASCFGASLTLLNPQEPTWHSYMCNSECSTGWGHLWLMRGQEQWIDINVLPFISQADGSESFL